MTRTLINKTFTCVSLFILLFSQSATGDTAISNPLLLGEAIKLALDQGPQSELFRKSASRVKADISRIEKQSTVSRLNLGVAGLANEVADSYDLEGQATRTGQLTGSYRKTYENGFYWQVSQIIRKSTPISDSGEETSLIKSIVSADYPLVGKKRYQKGHSNRLERLSLRSEDQKLLSERVFLQSQVAEHYLKVLREQLLLRQAQELVQLTMNLHTWEESNPDTRNLLKLEEIKLENLSYSQQVEFHKDEVECGLSQVRYLTGQDEETLELILPSIPKSDPSMKLYLEAHQQSNPLLQGLRNQIALIMAEKEMGQHRSDPDLSVGAMLGQSKDQDSSGTNLKVYMNVTYEFGDGRDDKVHLASMKIEELNLKLELEKQKSKLLAHQTSQKLKEKRRHILFKTSELNLTQRHLKLNQNMFEKRELSKYEVFKRKRQLIHQTLDLELAKLGYWETLLNASRQIGIEFSRLLTNKNGGSIPD